MGTKHVLLGLCLASVAQGAELRHTLQADDTPEAMQTLGTCQGISYLEKVAVCSPRGVLEEPSGAIRLEGLGQVNEEGFTIAQRLVDADVDSPFFRRLFSEQNFQSFSALVKVGTYFGRFSLVYTPVHVAGAIKLENPALPVIHAGLVSQSVMTLQYNWLRPLCKSYEMVLSPGVAAVNRRFVSLDSDLITLSVSDAKKLVVQNKYTLGDGSLALGLLAKQPFRPSFFIQGANLASGDPCPDCGEPFIDVKSAVSRRVTTTVSVTMDHLYGASILAASGTARQKATEELETEPTIAYSYKLATLSAHMAASPTQNAFGFLFDTDFYRLGIRYTSEKQPNTLAIDRLRNTYVVFSMVL